MKKTGSEFEKLVEVMRKLRSKDGCPWDREQTHKSLLRYLREESAEVEIAVKRGDWDNLCEELGDVLLQVVFHAEIARQAGLFNIDDVVRGIHKKLVRRHPHVFGRKSKINSPAKVVIQWEEIKKKEKLNRIRRLGLKREGALVEKTVRKIPPVK
ncbi:MAG: MazG nucleotide pyrophosphohydrolase domain-containing protein [Elusimicrobiaceae bacterium]